MLVNIRELDILISGTNAVLKGIYDNKTKSNKIAIIVKDMVRGVENDHTGALQRFLSIFVHKLFFHKSFVLNNLVSNMTERKLTDEYTRLEIYRISDISIEIYVMLIEALQWQKHLTLCVIEILDLGTRPATSIIDTIFSMVIQCSTKGQTIIVLLDVLIFAFLTNSVMIGKLSDTHGCGIITKLFENKEWFIGTPEVGIKLMLYFIQCSFHCDAECFDANGIESFVVQCTVEETNYERQLDRLQCTLDVCENTTYDNIDTVIGENTRPTTRYIHTGNNSSGCHMMHSRLIDTAICCTLYHRFHTDQMEIYIACSDHKRYSISVYDIVKTFYARFTAILETVDKINYENHIVSNNTCCAEFFASLCSRVNANSLRSIVVTQFEQSLAESIHKQDLLIVWLKFRSNSNISSDFDSLDRYIKDNLFRHNLSDYKVDSLFQRIKIENNQILVYGSDEWRQRLRFLDFYIQKTPVIQSGTFIFEDPETTVYCLLTTTDREQSSDDSEQTFDSSYKMVEMLMEHKYLLLEDKYLVAYVDYCERAMTDDTFTTLLKPLTEAVSVWPLPLLESKMIDRCQKTTVNQSQVSDLTVYQQRVTALFNQLVDNDDSQSQVSALSLLNAPYVISKAVATAMRNRSQIGLIIKLLRSMAMICKCRTDTGDCLLGTALLKLTEKNVCDRKQTLNILAFVSEAVQDFTYQLDNTCILCPAILPPQQFAKSAILPNLNAANMLQSSRPISALLSTELLYTMLIASNTQSDWLLELNPHAVLFCLCEMLEDSSQLLGDEDTSAIYIETKTRLMECVEAVLEYIKENDHIANACQDWFTSKMSGADPMTNVRVCRVLPPPLNSHQHLEEIAACFTRGNDGVDWSSVIKFAAVNDNCADACSSMSLENLRRGFFYDDLITAFTQVIVTLTLSELKRVAGVLCTLTPVIISHVPPHWDATNLSVKDGCGVVTGVLVDVLALLFDEELCPWVNKLMLHHAIQLTVVTVQSLCAISEKNLTASDYIRLHNEIFSHICRLLAKLPTLFTEAVEVLAMHLIQSVKAIKTRENQELVEVKSTVVSLMRTKLSSVPHQYKTLEKQLMSDVS